MDECRAVQAQLQDDLENQRLVPVSLYLDRVFTDATELSQLHTAKLLARSLDLLDVAAAHVMVCTTFVSADDRQLAVAKTSGLTVDDIKRRRCAPAAVTAPDGTSPVIIDSALSPWVADHSTDGAPLIAEPAPSLIASTNSQAIQSPQASAGAAA
jgi:hypothetical protein